jgi:hypothetical protein
MGAWGGGGGVGTGNTSRGNKEAEGPLEGVVELPWELWGALYQLATAGTTRQGGNDTRRTILACRTRPGRLSLAALLLFQRFGFGSSASALADCVRHQSQGQSQRCRTARSLGSR